MNLVTLVYLVMFFFGIFFLLIFLIMHFRYRKELYSYPEPKRHPIISILVPAFNEQESLEETIDSLMSLDYPSGKKEIIIINDGSSDGTLGIAQRMAERYKNVSVINKKNSGKAKSLNIGVSRAKGSDWLKNKLSFSGDLFSTNKELTEPSSLK